MNSFKVVHHAVSAEQLTGIFTVSLSRSCACLVDYEAPDEAEALSQFITGAGRTIDDQVSAFAKLVLLGRDVSAMDVLTQHVPISSKGSIQAHFTQDLCVSGFAENSPAEAAGMMIGDQVVSCTLPVVSFSHILDIKPTRGSQLVLLRVIRCGKYASILLRTDAGGLLGLDDDGGFPALHPRLSQCAFKAGLRSGDSIVSMTMPVLSLAHVQKLVEQLQPGSCISIACLRSTKCETSQIAMAIQRSAKCLPESSAFVRLPPCAIRFTQNTIKGEFQDGRSLLDIATRLADALMEKRDIEMIKVVKHDDGLYYSLDNRRLAVFRLLELAGKTRQIKARLTPMSVSEWRRKFDTQTAGVSIRVRGPERYVIGASKADTSFPFPHLQNNINESRSSLRGESFCAVAAVASFTPESAREPSLEDILAGMDSDTDS